MTIKRINNYRIQTISKIDINEKDGGDLNFKVIDLPIEDGLFIEKSNDDNKTYFAIAKVYYNKRKEEVGIDFIANRLEYIAGDDDWTTFKLLYKIAADILEKLNQ